MNWFKKNKRIFLDHASTTPVEPAVLKQMSTIQKDFWANPSSIHDDGLKAKELLREARSSIALSLGVQASEVYFTSGGTEALNIAILGTALAYRRVYDKEPHIITSTIEHPAVLEPIKHLARNGLAKISYIQPNEEGIVSPESIKKELCDETALVVIQHANNEIGVIQPVQTIGRMIEQFRGEKKGHHSKFSHQPHPYFLVDASQSILYENVSPNRLHADIIVFDGIKMYGPRGVGAMVARRFSLIDPIIFGGGQEEGLRPGTENVASACGLAEALKIADKIRKSESERLAKIRDYFFGRIEKEFPKISINGSKEFRLPNNINICIKDEKVDSEFLVIKLDTLGFSASSASACHTLSLENSSYVVSALGDLDCASRSLRFTLGRDTKRQDIDRLIDALKKIL